MANATSAVMIIQSILGESVLQISTTTDTSAEITPILSNVTLFTSVGSCASTYVYRAKIAISMTMSQSIINELIFKALENRLKAYMVASNTPIVAEYKTVEWLCSGFAFFLTSLLFAMLLLSNPTFL